MLVPLQSRNLDFSYSVALERLALDACDLAGKQHLRGRWPANRIDQNLPYVADVVLSLGEHDGASQSPAERYGILDHTSFAELDRDRLVRTACKGTHLYVSLDRRSRGGLTLGASDAGYGIQLELARDLGNKLEISSMLVRANGTYHAAAVAAAERQRQGIFRTIPRSVVNVGRRLPSYRVSSARPAYAIPVGYARP